MVLFITTHNFQNNFVLLSSPPAKDAESQSLARAAYEHARTTARHQAPPHGALLRPPRQGEPHHAPLQAHMRHFLEPTLDRGHHHLHSVAQFTAPPAQILHPRVFGSGLGPRQRLRECPDRVQRHGPELQPKHRDLLRVDVRFGLLQGPENRVGAAAGFLLRGAEDHEGAGGGADRSDAEREQPAVDGIQQRSGEGDGGFPAGDIVHDPVQDIHVG